MAPLTSHVTVSDSARSLMVCSRFVSNTYKSD
jgi:hypothetical protein